MVKMINWFNLVPAQENFFRESLEELVTILKDKYPDLTEIRLQRVTADEESALSRLTTFRTNVGFGDPQPTCLNKYEYLIGFCAKTEAFAEDLQAQNGQACWGATYANAYALAWKPDNKYLIWHEFLHLLYAEDCYDAKSPTTCGNAYCLMQHEPTAEYCNNGLYLCDKVEKKIKTMNPSSGSGTVPTVFPVSDVVTVE